MEAIAVGVEGVDGGGGEVAVVAGVVGGEVALEDVAAPLAVVGELITPREPAAGEPAPGRVLPLGLGRQGGAGPAAERVGVEPRDVHGRVVAAMVDGGVGAFGVTPVGAVDRQPPRGGADPVADVGRVTVEGEVEHRRHADVFGVGHPAGGLDEGRKPLVGDGDRVEEERGDGHAVGRLLPVGGVALAEGVTHREGAARHEHLPARVGGRRLDGVEAGPVSVGCDCAGRFGADRGSPRSTARRGGGAVVGVHPGDGSGGRLC